jgi:hypothetical protein
MSKKIITFASLLLLSLTMASTVLAEDSVVNFTPMVSIPGSGFLSQQPVMVKDDTSMICDYIIAVYKYGIAIIGILAVLAVAIGGVMWIVAAGNSGMVGQGKEWISSGIIGLVLALGSFILLATINKDLVSCKISSIESITKLNQDLRNRKEMDNSMPVPEEAVCVAMVYNPIDGNAPPQDCYPGWVISSNSNCPTNAKDFIDFPQSKCCCPDPQLAGPNFCLNASEGDTCLAGTRWGFCENKICRACRQPTDIVYNKKNSTITQQELDSIPENSKCYRNTKDWECQAPAGICGDKGQGDCNMYTWDSATGKLTNINPLYAGTHACNQGDTICVCELGF